MLFRSGLVALLALSRPAAAQDNRSPTAEEYIAHTGGEATMVTSDLAKFMAGAALKNSIAGMGAKPAGEAKMTCKDGIASVYCLAQQRACK